jgi:hypothetical protein
MSEPTSTPTPTPTPTTSATPTATPRVLRPHERAEGGLKRFKLTVSNLHPLPHSRGSRYVLAKDAEQALDVYLDASGLKAAYLEQCELAERDPACRPAVLAVELAD